MTIDKAGKPVKNADRGQMGTKAMNSTPKKMARVLEGYVREPAPADYSDTISDAYLDRLKAAVPAEDYKDAEYVSKPAW